MNDTFVDKLCTIYSYSSTVIDGTDIPVKNEIYTLVPCDFGKSGISSPNYLDGKPAINIDQETMKVILNRGYEQVRKGMLIDLFEKTETDPVFSGSYLISSVEFVKDRNEVIDNIYLGCTQIDGESV